MIARLKAWALWALFCIGAILFALVKGRQLCGWKGRK